MRKSNLVHSIHQRIGVPVGSTVEDRPELVDVRRRSVGEGIGGGVGEGVGDVVGDVC